VQFLAFLAFISGHQLLFLAATRLTPFPFFLFLFLFSFSFYRQKYGGYLYHQDQSLNIETRMFEIMCTNTIGAAPAQNLSRHYLCTAAA